MKERKHFPSSAHKSRVQYDYAKGKINMEQALSRFKRIDKIVLMRGRESTPLPDKIFGFIARWLLVPGICAFIVAFMVCLIKFFE